MMDRSTITIASYCSFLLLVTSLLPLTVALAVCDLDPVLDEATVNVTNNRTYLLSEITDENDPNCPNLVCWLDNVANTAFSNATLVVDRVCTLNQTLIVPPRMVIAGVGMDGEGILSFQGLGTTQAAIAVAPGPNTAGVTIRDG